MGYEANRFNIAVTPGVMPQAIFSHSREVEPVLVQKAVMAVLRLCTRLLPYKPDITASLVKGESRHWSYF
jgi:hypothetical protein